MIITSTQLHQEEINHRTNIIDSLMSVLNKVWHEFIKDMDEPKYRELDINFLLNNSLIIAEHDSDGNMDETIDSVSQNGGYITTSIGTTGDTNKYSIGDISNEHIIAIIKDFEKQLQDPVFIQAEHEGIEI